MNNNNTESGMGLGWVLVVLFTVLKLMGLISWSWWWVFSPIWITLLIGAVVLIAWSIVAIIKVKENE